MRFKKPYLCTLTMLKRSSVLLLIVCTLLLASEGCRSARMGGGKQKKNCNCGF